MKTIILILTGSFLVLSAFSQDVNFESWDADDNDKISKNEYALNSDMFSNWDDDDNNRISISEFNNSLYALFDGDSNDEISTGEWQEVSFLLDHSGNKAVASTDTVSNQYGMGAETDTAGVRYGAGSVSMTTWDADKNNELDKDEFEKNISQIFNKWDKNQDNYISKTEFYQSTFNWWDTDSDGNITEKEFNKMKEVRDGKSFWEKLF
ncbi:MAG: hypothetical protein HC906_09495 [Bacteroidales bacterium]|nr:hypothetical protein [Bacteroidales bacterium]